MPASNPVPGQQFELVRWSDISDGDQVWSMGQVCVITGLPFRVDDAYDRNLPVGAMRFTHLREEGGEGGAGFAPVRQLDDLVPRLIPPRTGGPRRYQLAADPVRGRGMQPAREILEITDGRRDVILVVADSDAFDTLEVLRRVYQDGREDRAADLKVAVNDVITVVPGDGPERTARVSHVERTVILLDDCDAR